VCEFQLNKSKDEVIFICCKILANSYMIHTLGEKRRVFRTKKPEYEYQPMDGYSYSGF